MTPLVSKPSPASVNESVRKDNTFINGNSLEGELKSQSLGAFFSQMWPILLCRMLRKIAPWEHWSEGFCPCKDSKVRAAWQDYNYRYCLLWDCKSWMWATWSCLWNLPLIQVNPFHWIKSFKKMFKFLSVKSWKIEYYC